MGKSAKFLKRTHKKIKSSIAASKSTQAHQPTTAVASTKEQYQIQAAKKKASLKAKATKSSQNNSQEKGVLGGADYVTLMMGGRRKAKAEAALLPKEDENMDTSD
ncbi:hypothetical protein AX16_007992 [Volvariella volvacea WC 439]|nr:hypothetical protein AX16_007992 [Volvariella volvacea WC 439]